MAIRIFLEGPESVMDACKSASNILNPLITGFFCYNGSRDGIVDIDTIFTGWNVRGSNLGKARIFFSFPVTSRLALGST
jgi:hypothetical protein